MGSRFWFRIKEKVFKNIFLLQDVSRVLASVVSWICNLITTLCGILFMTLLVARLGFYHHQLVHDNLDLLIRNIFFVTYLCKYIREAIIIVMRKTWARWVDFAICMLATIVFVANANISVFQFLSGSFLTEFYAIAVALSLIFISDFYKISNVIMSTKMSPPLLFAFGFLVMIFIGSGLLMLPNIHNGQITYFQALFTSTSAICVSGLSVIDMATIFTFKGQIILMLLFQIGGLGVMVFTGVFAYAFTGTVSIKDRLLLKDIFSSDAGGDIFVFLTKVLSLTLLFETIGAVAIYFAVHNDVSDPIFFAIFHSISAFCNCGISTFSDGFANPALIDNNPLLMIVAILTTFGGIGFPVLIAVYSWLRFKSRNMLGLPVNHYRVGRPVGSDIATRFAIITTIGILVIGTVVYYLLEIGNTLADDDVMSRWIKAFFCCATARTAGFNVSDVSCWSYATMIFIMGIMWVGASPGSTGGGIKTTTFAIALLAIANFVRGNRHVKIKFHRIGVETIIRVLVLIAMSIFLIFIAFILFAFFEPNQNPLYLLFDTISMYSTTGLSMVGISNLSTPSQVLTLLMMFVGRVGPLTLLSGIFISRKKEYGRTPYENLTIN